MDTDRRYQDTKEIIRRHLRADGDPLLPQLLKGYSLRLPEYLVNSLMKSASDQPSISYPTLLQNQVISTHYAICLDSTPEELGFLRNPPEARAHEKLFARVHQVFVDSGFQNITELARKSALEHTVIFLEALKGQVIARIAYDLGTYEHTQEELTRKLAYHGMEPLLGNWASFFLNVDHNQQVHDG